MSRRIEEFEELRPLLFSIAHRILGSESDAEDAVREARIRYEAAPAVSAPLNEFLPDMVAQVSEDIRCSARPRPRRQPGHGRAIGLPGRTPEPRGPAEPAGPSAATAVALLERLPPLERAYFVLREIFGCDTARIASAMGRPEADCRRLGAAVSRAGGRRNGPPLWPGVITGSERVARAMAAVFPALLTIGVTMEQQAVLSGPGIVFRDRTGAVLSALALELLDGRIQTIRWVRDPLTGSVADAAS
ncbi:sigma factor-like helix-turn-helix DNA-binding protein [Streptomyces beihaiensis]|uniref:RNA polymerase subunit sigma-24 n=1 Tax=Streptomyces beihaiensis TaxID=2984495 RepID=A0ABT3TTQ9_9ACTN|nr:sigma factor-like helix-turn-helix DNA-binding protein [Streptomyces beihaiensis]MCX3059470.1 RNA polymerase subunit sigma-24 [Streptomyces beihaiensis]